MGRLEEVMGPEGQVWRWDFNLEVVGSQGDWGGECPHRKQEAGGLLGQGKVARQTARPGGMRAGEVGGLSLS